jgi:EAL domain-containing protein (putative c-di-GMP-specific phosphodiesterase class I)
MEPNRLELEVTETSFLENADQCQANLKLLRTIGIRIALDEFGTGYSSFNNLRNYQVDRLKIDPSFINAIESSPEGSAIIRAIIALARSTGLKVTAEGVETIEQSDFLSAAGCDELQGFLMSRAVPIGRIDEMLGVDPTVRREARPDAAAA